jgi:hypothetical protein
MSIERSIRVDMRAEVVIDDCQSNSPEARLCTRLVRERWNLLSPGGERADAPAQIQVVW